MSILTSTTHLRVDNSVTGAIYFGLSTRYASSGTNLDRDQAIAVRDAIRSDKSYRQSSDMIVELIADPTAIKVTIFNMSTVVEKDALLDAIEAVLKPEVKVITDGPRLGIKIGDGTPWYADIAMARTLRTILFLKTECVSLYDAVKAEMLEIKWANDYSDVELRWNGATARISAKELTRSINDYLTRSL